MLQLGGAISDVDEAATAYSERAAKFYWIAEPVWDNPVDDSRCIVWGRKAGGRLAAMSQAGNYLNEQADTARMSRITPTAQKNMIALRRLKLASILQISFG